MNEMKIDEIRANAEALKYDGWQDVVKLCQAHGRYAAEIAYWRDQSSQVIETLEKIRLAKIEETEKLGETIGMVQQLSPLMESLSHVYELDEDEQAKALWRLVKSEGDELAHFERVQHTDG